jgi:hypothetical protein
MAYAEMLWADRLGIYLRAARQDGSPAIDLRVPFVRAVEDEREARSALTMMAQVAWEAQRWVPSRAGQGRAGRRAGERLGMRWGVCLVAERHGLTLQLVPLEAVQSR